MRVIPVLDLLGGVVVRAVGGRRQEYRPIVTPLTASSEPLAVAIAFRDHFGLTELYVADLDAIAGAPPAVATIQRLRQEGPRLWLDAGIRDAPSADVVATTGVERLVVGLETVAGPDVLETIVRRYDERVVFSLDLRDGVPLTAPGATWPGADAVAIAEEAIRRGVRRLLLLDLSRVGGHRGTGTEELCDRIRQFAPEIELSVGGGVRGVADLRRLAGLGVSAALVATALHDGSLRREDVCRGT